MKVYVGGSFLDKESVREIQSLVKNKGYTVTFDWTSTEYETDSVDYLKGCCELDTEGVLDADVVILVFNQLDYSYRGTFTEMGIAIGSGKRTIALSLQESVDYTNTYMRNVFFWSKRVERVWSIEDLLLSL